MVTELNGNRIIWLQNNTVTYANNYMVTELNGNRIT